MRGSPGSMEVLRPSAAQEAVLLFGRAPEAIPLAGGTDFMVSWNAGLLNGKTVLDLSAIREWSRIRTSRKGLWMGSLASHWQIQNHPVVKKHFPLLANACATIGGIQIQLRGTLGGNLANASPAGDTFPPLAVYEPVVHTVSPGGARTMPISELFTGVKRTSLKRSELIESIEVPFLPTRPRRHMFWKVGTRAASAISKTVAAGLLWINREGTIRELRFALGSMAPTVRRLHQVEAFVTGKKPTAKVLDEACALLEKDVAPIDDVRSTADYRLEVSKNLLRSFLDPGYRG
ncbi:MAG: FAD binding domain-containing protein [Vicinamibacteria bacterium]